MSLSSFSMYGSIINGGILQTGNGEMPVGSYGFATTVLLLVSQALNTILFNVGAFWGIYSAKTILSIALSSYVIFLVTSLADTPFVYLARYLKDKNIFFRASFLSQD